MISCGFFTIFGSSNNQKATLKHAWRMATRDENLCQVSADKTTLNNLIGSLTWHSACNHEIWESVNRANLPRESKPPVEIKLISGRVTKQKGKWSLAKSLPKETSFYNCEGNTVKWKGFLVVGMPPAHRNWEISQDLTQEIYLQKLQQSYYF